MEEEKQQWLKAIEERIYYLKRIGLTITPEMEQLMKEEVIVVHEDGSIVVTGKNL